MSAQKFVLVSVLVAVAVAAGITVPIIVERFGDWLLDHVEPGQIASGMTQSYLGNTAHSVTTCGLESIQAWQRPAASCWGTAVVVILILFGLVIIAGLQQAAKKRLRLAEIRDQAAGGNNHADNRSVPVTQSDLREVSVKVESLENLIRDGFLKLETKQHPGA